MTAHVRHYDHKYRGIVDYVPQILGMSWELSNCRKVEQYQMAYVLEAG